jgi:hypothetical protein
MRYAPPIKRENLDLLTGASKRYPLRDDGSIERRMKINGGTLRMLFSAFSLEHLEGQFELKRSPGRSIQLNAPQFT